MASILLQVLEEVVVCVGVCLLLFQILLPRILLCVVNARKETLSVGFTQIPLLSCLDHHVLEISSASLLVSRGRLRILHLHGRRDSRSCASKRTVSRHLSMSIDSSSATAKLCASCYRGFLALSLVLCIPPAILVSPLVNYPLTLHWGKV